MGEDKRSDVSTAALSLASNTNPAHKKEVLVHILYVVQQHSYLPPACQSRKQRNRAKEGEKRRTRNFNHQDSDGKKNKNSSERALKKRLGERRWSYRLKPDVRSVVNVPRSPHPKHPPRNLLQRPIHSPVSCLSSSGVEN